MAQTNYATPYTFTTLAGRGSTGADDGTGSSVEFNQPEGIAIDSNGNIFVSDFGDWTIRKITPAGVVTTFAGTAGAPGHSDGTGSNATFDFPGSMVIDANNNLYVLDYDRIRKVTSAGVVTTFVTGLPYYYGQPLAIDGSGNFYTSNGSNIYKISPSGVSTTFAAGFYNVVSLAVDGNYNVYVSSTGPSYSGAIISMVTQAGVVTPLAGSPTTTGYADGTGGAATFSSPIGLTVDVNGNVYVADNGNGLIRKSLRQAWSRPWLAIPKIISITMVLEVPQVSTALGL